MRTYSVQLQFSYFSSTLEMGPGSCTSKANDTGDTFILTGSFKTDFTFKSKDSTGFKIPQVAECGGTLLYFQHLGGEGLRVKSSRSPTATL